MNMINKKRICILLAEEYLLLHCDEAIFSPSISTSGKGDPLAKIALPPVAAWACSAVHSDLENKKEIFYNHFCLEIVLPWGRVAERKDDGRIFIFIDSFQHLFCKQSSTGRESFITKLSSIHCMVFLPISIFGWTFLTVSRRLMPSILASSTAKLERS